MLEAVLARLVRFLTTERTEDALRAGMILLLALVFARLSGRWVRKFVARAGDRERGAFFGRLLTWAVFLVGAAASFEELGFKLGVVLGTAGVLSVAVGFAAQTTLSNLISGFLLFGERPFKVGDVIEIDGLSGEVLSIEFMATTLRTADNRFVRIPNELVLKAKVINATRFPKRRVDIVVPILPSDDFSRLCADILERASRQRLCLPEPPPSVSVSAFGEQSQSIQVSLWTETKDALAVRQALSAEIREALLGLRRSQKPGPGAI